MAAPALDVDKEQVRLLVMQMGVRDAARAMGLNENTVAAWSARGRWLAPVEQTTPKSMQPIASNAIKPVQALANVLSENEERTKLAIALATTKGTERIADMDADEVLLNTGQLKDLTQVAKDNYGWAREREGQGANILLNIAFLGGAAQPVEHEIEPVTTDVVQE